MESGESEHPLRLDPLNALPDAVTVPRRPRPRAVDKEPPKLDPDTIYSSRRERTPETDLLSGSSADRRALHEDIRDLLSSATKDDPLISAVAKYAQAPENPPAGEAYATDIREALSGYRDVPQGGYDTPPIAAGIVERSDVTLLPASTEKGAAAGVYEVRSRQNWSLGSSRMAGASSLPHSTSQEQDYYHVKRSLADFAWLEERLRHRYQGIIVPSLPPMALAGRLKYGYAYDMEKLRGLEKFLRRIANHAVLSTGDEVLAFLGATGEDAWQKIRREPISHENSVTTALFGEAHDRSDANALGKLSNWGEKFLWQTGRKINKGLVWFLDRDSPSDPKKKDDSAEARLERLHNYVQELGTSLSTVRNAVQKVSTNRSQEIRGMSTMQAAIHELGEREGGQFGAYLQAITLEIPTESEECDDQQSSLSKETKASSDPKRKLLEGSGVQALSESNSTTLAARAISEVFRDYEERAKGAQQIMNARREEQDAYEHALAVYTKLRDRLESRAESMWETAPNTAQPNGKGLDELVNDVSAASRRLADVRRHYQAVALSTTDELRRLRTEMHEDIGSALQKLAMQFARQHDAHARAWEAFAQTLRECREDSEKPD